MLWNLMNKIKKLFSRQSEDKSDEDKVRPLNAQIIFGVDEGGEVMLDYDYIDGCESDVAALMFYIYSGYLAYFVANTLPQYINDQEKMSFIVDMTAELIDEYNKQNAQSEEQPVVDPMDVFNTRINNEPDQ